MSPRVSKDYKKEKKRELLQAATRVFMNRGYTQATMKHIMEEAGVSRGALYAYFDNIEHVFMEVLQFEDQEVIRFFEPTDDSPLWNQLTDWVKGQQTTIEGIHQSLLRAKAEFFLSTHYLQPKENFPYIAERYQNVMEAIMRFIEIGIERGQFKPSLPSDSIALSFISFLDGLMLNTFQLGTEKTKVHDQLRVLLFSLKQMLDPVVAEKG